MRRVVIIEPVLKQYRRRFLIELADRLAHHDLELRVAYSAPGERELAKSDHIELDGIGVEVGAWRLFGDRVVLQRPWHVVRDADLVIVDQGNRQLFNLVALALSRLGRWRVAYFGHGYDHQAEGSSVSAWVKRRLVTRVDWWFAYTAGVARYLIANGVRAETITTVQNTVDTSELVDAIARVDAPETRRRLGIGMSARVGLYCGGLYSGKQLPFLIAAAAKLPNFALIVIGDGSERGVVDALARERAFVHYVGPVFGADRAAYFAISDVFVMPALVGLAIVDAFAAGLPVITTDLRGHGPELEYLVDGVNGVIARHELEAYAAAVARVLDGPPVMRGAARETAGRLSLDHMVTQFADGIVRCLR